jgi:hypothetical protein
MVVRYKGGSRYVCNHLRQQHEVPVCQCLRAAPIDAQVAAAFLEAIASAEIDALSRALKAQRRSCGTLKSSRFSGSAIRPRSLSANSVVSIRTTGSSPASSSGDGRRLSLSYGAQKKR